MDSDKNPSSFVARFWGARRRCSKRSPREMRRRWRRPHWWLMLGLFGPDPPKKRDPAGFLVESKMGGRMDACWVSPLHAVLMLYFPVDLIFPLWIVYSCYSSSGSSTACDASLWVRFRHVGVSLETAEISTWVAGCFLKLLDHLWEGPCNWRF